MIYLFIVYFVIAVFLFGYDTGEEHSNFGKNTFKRMLKSFVIAFIWPIVILIIAIMAIVKTIKEETTIYP